MSRENHFDVIIIGTGAGGGTLAYHLAPSGKRILILERGDYVAREKDNWNPQVVNLEGKYNTKEQWRDADWQGVTPAYQLLRWRQHEVLWGGAVSLAATRFPRDSPLWRRLSRLANQL